MKSILVLLFVFTAFIGQTFAFDAAKTFKNTCATCHTIGGGDLKGPDLAGVSKRRKLDWIVKFVNYPAGMIDGDEDEEGYEKPDPMAKKLFAVYKTQMTDQEMSKTEVSAMLKYIDSFKKTPKGKILNIK